MYSIETSGASPCTASGHCQFVKVVVRLQVASRRAIARSVRQAQSPRKRLRLTSSINRRPNFQSMSQYVIIRSCFGYFSSIRPHKKAVSAKMARRTKNCLEGEAADLIKSQSPISHRPQPHSDPLTIFSLQFRSVPFPAEFGQCPLIIIIFLRLRRNTFPSFRFTDDDGEKKIPDDINSQGRDGAKRWCTKCRG